MTKRKSSSQKKLAILLKNKRFWRDIVIISLPLFTILLVIPLLFLHSSRLHISPPLWKVFKAALSTDTTEPVVSVRDQTFINNSEEKEATACGGWDTSGEVVCECEGKLTKPACKPGAICDSGTYFCDSQCGSCCYKGTAENHPLPKCN